jgi:4-hydroxy-4-methyl-2-oxoglutarate aldolase
MTKSDHQAELPLPSMDGLRTADIVDAMGRRHRHRCHILDLVSPTPHRALCGRAATISFAPSCEVRLPVDRFNFAAAFDEAVGENGRGKVLVLASNGHRDASLGGGTKLSRLDHRGLAGLLADGRLRDFDQLAQYRFTARCHGETTHWGGGEVTPFEAGGPVVFDRVLIMPNDLIYADSSGAVVIPAAEAAAVVSLALEIASEEAKARTGIGDEERRRR